MSFGEELAIQRAELTSHGQGDVPYWTFPLLEQAGVRQAVLGRRGGVSPPPYESLNLSSAVGDAPANFAENRRRAYGVLGRSFERLVHAQLVHEARVVRVDEGDHGRVIPQCDALITNQPGCGLTMNYADCAPIFLYDPQQQAIGLAHAGWAGTVRDVAGEMVRAMVAAFGSEPAELCAAVGPCIGVDVYEVDEPVITAVATHFGSATTDLLIPQPNSPRPHFDLGRANWLNLRQAGVQQISLATLHTNQTESLFSHRLEQGRTGRFGVMLILEKRPVGDKADR